MVRPYVLNYNQHYLLYLVRVLLVFFPTATATTNATTIATNSHYYSHFFKKN